MEISHGHPCILNFFAVTTMSSLVFRRGNADRTDHPDESFSTSFKTAEMAFSENMSPLKHIPFSHPLSGKLIVKMMRRENISNHQNEFKTMQ